MFLLSRGLSFFVGRTARLPEVDRLCHSACKQGVWFGGFAAKQGTGFSQERDSVRVLFGRRVPGERLRGSRVLPSDEGPTEGGSSSVGSSVPGRPAELQEDLKR